MKLCLFLVNDISQNKLWETQNLKFHYCLTPKLKARKLISGEKKQKTKNPVLLTLISIPKATTK